MTKLTWDIASAKFFETGIDRGVLYLPDNTGISWNGLTGFNQGFDDNESNPLYFDGGKYMDDSFIGAFGGTLTAYTYPDEFVYFVGRNEPRTGWFVDNQGNQTFGLAFRTIVGNDVSSTDYAYRIHILYNLMAVPSETVFETLSDTLSPIEFEWTIFSTPEQVTGYTATSHVIIDSRYISSTVLSSIEDKLYGTSTTPPTLPTIDELITIVNATAIIIITNNGDGTWTIDAPSANLTMLDSTTFQLTGVTATYLDADTYMVSTT
jgi:hypothetical protein